MRAAVVIQDKMLHSVPRRMHTGRFRLCSVRICLLVPRRLLLRRNVTVYILSYCHTVKEYSVQRRVLGSVVWTVAHPTQVLFLTFSFDGLLHCSQLGRHCVTEYSAADLAIDRRASPAISMWRCSAGSSPIIARGL